jgi:hypothetical protein
MAGEYKPPSSCWFGSKKATCMCEKISSVNGDEMCFIFCDNLVSFNVKRGDTGTY